MQTDIHTRLKIQTNIIEELTSNLDDKDKVLLFQKHFDQTIQKEFNNRRFPKMKIEVSIQ